MRASAFPDCPICGSRNWTPAYRGPVRDGAFGSVVEGATVARCGGCEVERLDEHICPDDSFYESESYRRKLQQSLDTPSHFAAHDHLQIFALNQLWPMSLRGRTIADIGCAGGSFLDHVSGLAERLIAIEPCSVYHPDLHRRGYEVFAYARDAWDRRRHQVDIAVSLQVIEHVRDPRGFLEDIRPLVRDDGLVLISTPNRRDILMDLLPEEFRAFFYRVVHRWYFDEASLGACAERAGFKVDAVRHVHRYGLSNALAWLRDRRPTGHARIEGIDPQADRSWQAYLDVAGRSDCLFMTLRPNS